MKKKNTASNLYKYSICFAICDCNKGEFKVIYKNTQYVWWLDFKILI